MPVLRGSAKKAWLERMANQSGTDSPYRWSDVQGKSRSQEGQLRVLGYTLGRPEALTPWLEMLQNCSARIRGVYAPVMLANKVLQLLKITSPKKDDSISVLVTPDETGLRQTVLVGGHVRFSRLALNPHTEGDDWFTAVFQETTKLREYLIGNGLLKNDHVGIQINVVLPLSCNGTQPYLAQNMHPKDHYQWFNEALPNLLYVKALAKQQAWHQLAPPLYRKIDLSVQASRILYAAVAAIALAGLIFLGLAGSALWQKQNGITSAKEQATQANAQYQAIAKTFPQTPLTSVQLLDMSARWKVIEAEQPPNMKSALVIAGKTLERHPGLIIDTISWLADTTQTSSGSDNDVLGLEAAPDAASTLLQTAPSAAAATAATAKEKKEVTALVLRGTVRGVASDDLRGTRDVLNKLEDDFKRQTEVRLEITKRPLDLSAKSSQTGSGTQDRSELSFEIKLWQR